LSGILRSIAFLCFDYDLAKEDKDRKAKSLMEIQTLLVNAYFGIVEKIHFLEKEEGKLAVYFTYLWVFVPKEQRNQILGTDADGNQRKTPLYTNSTNDGSFRHRAQKRVSDELRRRLQAAEEEGKELEGLIVEDEFDGLESGFFPVDIAIRKKDNELLLFAEIDGEQYHYYEGEIAGKMLLRRSSELKRRLYQHYYPNVPMKRVLVVKGGGTSIDDVVGELVDEVKSLLQPEEQQILLSHN
jgi:hypothetical protein